jgi:predicted choloylglycine hydrolase
MNTPDRRAFLQQSTVAGLAFCAADDWAASAENKKLAVVTLEGSAFERGVIHGKTLKAQIHELVKLWKADLVERYKMPADAFIKKFVQQTDFQPAIKKWTPELLEEIRGIAKGADLDFESVFVFQLPDEYWVNGPGITGDHCSAVGFSRKGDRPTLIAQNMDLEGFRDGFQVILHIKYPGSKLESLVVTNAGLIALNGLNNRSIGICCNTLSQLAYCKDGLPVACVVRGVLEQQTEEAAVDFVRRIKHASGQNYIIGGPAKVYDLECSASKVAPFTTARPDMVWHTNHPLVNDDYSAKFKEEPDKKKALANTTARLESVQKRVGKDAVPGLDLIKTTLAAKDSADFPVCRPHKNQKDNFTFAATIMVLSDKPELHITSGPPDVNPYQMHSFTK